MVGIHAHVTKQLGIDQAVWWYGSSVIMTSFFPIFSLHSEGYIVKYSLLPYNGLGSTSFQNTIKLETGQQGGRNPHLFFYSLLYYSKFKILCLVHMNIVLYICTSFIFIK